jgi:C-terminal processing protease CtpA/Prc
MIDRVLKTKNDYEYYRELSFFMAFLKDGHTGVGRYPNVDRYTTIFKGYLIEFGRIEKKVIVTRINASKKDTIPLGSELLEVNGLLTEDYLAEFVIPYISASTDKSRDENAVKYILDGLPGMKYTIKIRTPENEIKSIQLVHGSLGEKFPPETLPKTEIRNPVEFKWFDNKTAYLALNSFKDSTIVDSFKKLLPELYKAEKLIIDIRENTGGNSEVGFEILSYLTEDEHLFIHSSRSRRHIAESKREGANISVKDTIGSKWKKEAYLNYHNKLYTDDPYKPYINDLTDNRIVIPTLVLIGGKTVSAAEDFLVPIKRMGHIKTMGETTNGSTGTLYTINLPGSWAYICSLQSFYPDGSEYVGVGIRPDIEVKRTIKGVINMKDEVLNRALKFLNETGK